MGDYIYIYIHTYYDERFRDYLCSPPNKKKQQLNKRAHTQTSERMLLDEGEYHVCIYIYRHYIILYITKKGCKDKHDNIVAL